jgi:hypothetical protein
VAGPLAVFATASAVTLGVLFGEAPATDTISARTTAGDLSAIANASQVEEREDTLSRSADRGAEKAEKKTKLERWMSAKAVKKAVKGADVKLWSTAPLNLWTEPGEKATQVGELAAERHVLVTGRSLYGRDEIVLDGRSRWVTSGYLQKEKPDPLAASCTNGTSVPSGVSANIVKVHQAVCAAFPSISVYGTFRGDGEHAQGLAVDIMVSGDLGWQVAEFVRENYADLGVSYLIYSQQIWSVDRAAEGWRGMEDRGSATANHYDHVHVTTY